MKKESLLLSIFSVLFVFLLLFTVLIFVQKTQFLSAQAKDILPPSVEPQEMEPVLLLPPIAEPQDRPEPPPTDTDPSVSTAPSEAPSGGLTVGAKGKIVGAASGLRVRSGPGTNYNVQASLVNGNEVTIVADAGNGWYQISYAGSNGKQTTGYIMGKYISVP